VLILEWKNLYLIIKISFEGDIILKIKDVEVLLFEVELPGSYLSYKKGKTFRLQSSLVRLITDQGIEGYCFAGGKAGASWPRWGGEAELISTLLRSNLIGEDPFARQKIWNKMWYLYRKKYLNESIMGAIDVAIWDIVAKSVGLPLYKFLGGYIDRVPAYASTLPGDHEEDGLKDPESFAKFAKDCKKRGYRAFKIHPWEDTSPEVDIETCRVVREEVGDDMILIFDPAGKYDRIQALKVGKALEKLNYHWFEDPVNQYDVTSYVELRKKLAIPICGCEINQGILFSVADFISRQAVDIITVDVRMKGGITPLLKIAALSEGFGVKMATHAISYNPIMMAANLHVAAAINNFELYECNLIHPNLPDNHNIGIKKPIDKIDSEGYIPLPSTPGLGIELDWQFIEKHKID